MQSPHTIEAELLPAPVTCMAFGIPPVAGVAQLLGLAPVPALGQPPLRLAVAAIQHKAQKLAIAHRPRCNLCGLHIDTVHGHLIVKGEIATAVAYAVDAGLHRPPCEVCMGRPGVRLGQRVRCISRPKRVAGKQMLDVGEQQLLMLLLVLQTQCDELGHRLLRRRLSLFHGRHQRQHLLIHHGAISHDLCQGWPGQQAPLGSRMPCPHLLVVGVEQHAIAGIENLMPLLMHSQYKGFKNQLVWARCHLAGLASGMDCTQASSADSGAASFCVQALTRSNCSASTIQSHASDETERG